MFRQQALSHSICLTYNELFHQSLDNQRVLWMSLRGTNGDKLLQNCHYESLSLTSSSSWFMLTVWLSYLNNFFTIFQWMGIQSIIIRHHTIYRAPWQLFNKKCSLLSGVWMQLSSTFTLTHSLTSNLWKTQGCEAAWWTNSYILFTADCT